jgi:hypothetical protein
MGIWPTNTPSSPEITIHGIELALAMDCKGLWSTHLPEEQEGRQEASANLRVFRVRPLNHSKGVQ